MLQWLDLPPGVGHPQDWRELEIRALGVIAIVVTIARYLACRGFLPPAQTYEEEELASALEDRGGLRLRP